MDEGYLPLERLPLERLPLGRRNFTLITASYVTLLLYCS